AIKLSLFTVYSSSDLFCLSAGYAFFLLIFHTPDQSITQQNQPEFMPLTTRCTELWNLLQMFYQTHEH
ncbi:hypothetical protein NDI36_31095, partial [Leptolyngbya boryana FACHB-1624]